MSTDNTEIKKEGKIITKPTEGRTENFLPPSNIATIYADKLTVAVNHTNETVTMSVLTMHPIPRLDEKLDIDNYAYELSGEVKTSYAEMDLLAMYYLTTRTSEPDKLWNLIQEHLRQFPEDKEKTMGFIRFGPTGIEPAK